jgi:Tetracyclin repressor-like, C-terminal domain
MRQFWAARLDAISVIVDRAIERGELRPGTDPAAFVHAMSAPLYCRLLLNCETVTERDADLGAAARAGVFRTPPDSAG